MKVSVKTFFKFIENSRKLVKIARDNGIVVCCDDVYNLLYYGEGNPPHRLFYYDNPKDSGYKGGNIISNGSFSKILSPAVRYPRFGCQTIYFNI